MEASLLPPLFAGWMDQLLPGPIPDEPLSSCGSCAMLPRPGENSQGGEFYHPRVKCCTYYPRLANFLVGRVLLDDPANFPGRAEIERRLREGTAVTPLGIDRSPTYTLLYERLDQRTFGKTVAMRCPHYQEETGYCGIWQHRESTCATWFCKHRRGAVGKRFWATLHHLLTHAEHALAHWCVLELDLGTAALRQLFPPGGARPEEVLDAHVLDAEPDPARQAALWGNWAGREAEFYRECARRIAPLSWDEVLTLGGPELRIHAVLTLDAYAALLDPSLPAALSTGSFQIVQLDDRAAQISAYSPLNPLSLSRRLLDLLPYFDGRDTAEALQAILAAEGVRVSEGLVRRLVDYGVLRSAD